MKPAGGDRYHILDLMAAAVIAPKPLHVPFVVSAML